jgi:hypothetical protein
VYTQNRRLWVRLRDNGRRLQKAAAMANQASTRTTQLYDRPRDDVSLEEVNGSRSNVAPSADTLSPDGLNYEINQLPIFFETVVVDVIALRCAGGKIHHVTGLRISPTGTFRLQSRRRCCSDAVRCRQMPSDAVRCRQMSGLIYDQRRAPRRGALTERGTTVPNAQTPKARSGPQKKGRDAAPNNGTEQLTAAKLEMFVSYATEDKELAETLQTVLQTHLGADFAHVWIDTQGLRAGFDIGTTIRAQIERSEILLIVYTGQQKDSHGYTGVEVGYFMGTHEPVKSDSTHGIVSFYLDHPPTPVSAFEGLSYGISPSTLALDTAEYLASLKLHEKHPIVQFFRDLEISVDRFRRNARLQPRENDLANRISTVRDLLTTTFNILKQRKESEIHPQNEMVIDVTQDISSETMELPGAALIKPMGAGTMAIFGLPERDTRWSDFLLQAKEKYRYVWKDAIETVIISSLDLLNVDNSQMVISHNERDLYRLVLTRSTKYYNGRREFHLYFVEVLRRHDFGNDDSTCLLKALGLCWRFRFMFFEAQSEFSGFSTRIKKDKEMRAHARKLIKELNLLKRDAAEAKLDDPIVWSTFIARDKLEEMNKLYEPIETDIRNAANGILAYDEAKMEEARLSLASAIEGLEGKFRERNAELIAALANKLTVLLDPSPSNAGSATHSEPAAQPVTRPSG